MSFNNQQFSALLQLRPRPQVARRIVLQLSRHRHLQLVDELQGGCIDFLQGYFELAIALHKARAEGRFPAHAQAQRE